MYSKYIARKVSFVVASLFRCYLSSFFLSAFLLFVAPRLYSIPFFHVMYYSCLIFTNRHGSEKIKKNYMKYDFVQRYSPYFFLNSSTKLFILFFCVPCLALVHTDITFDIIINNLHAYKK